MSLGTGTEDPLKSPKAPQFRHVFNDGFIPRLCRSFLSSLDGERAWQDLENRLDDCSKSDYFRWNIPLFGEEPRIDDLDQMERLRNSVHAQGDGSDGQRNTATALLTSSFYFELERMPVFHLGRYTCHGSIRCRNKIDAILDALERLHGDNLDFKIDDRSLGPLCRQGICSRCGTYVKRVELNVRHLEETVTIYIQPDHQARRKISGFPHTISWFIQQQRLDNEFGFSDQDLSQSESCKNCQQDHHSTRKRALDDLQSPRKRRKL